jgi:hypothetical protein
MLTRGYRFFSLADSPTAFSESRGRPNVKLRVAYV